MSETFKFSPAILADIVVLLNNATPGLPVSLKDMAIEIGAQLEEDGPTDGIIITTSNLTPPQRTVLREYFTNQGMIERV